MLRQARFLVVLVALAAALVPSLQAKEPEHIVVQHILISFKGKVDESKGVTRDKKAAKELAFELLDRAEAGEDFDAMVLEYSNDRHPGILALANINEPVLKDERGRKEMVAKFGDIAFRLEVGEVGIATYNSMTSPYGWHIIKRLE